MAYTKAGRLMTLQEVAKMTAIQQRAANGRQMASAPLLRVISPPGDTP
jgi:hypothetical protein